MKKILFGILTFLGIGLSFCSAQNIDLSFGDGGCFMDLSDTQQFYTFTNSESSTGLFMYFCKTNSRGGYLDDCGSFSSLVSPGELYNPQTVFSSQYIGCISFVSISSFSSGCSQGGGSSTSDIYVYYNNGNSSESITCDGTQAIEIQGLSTITSTNTFTPYYNIFYTDEDNQKLTESYSNSILYLENGQFKKTYTGNNDWILSVQGGSENSFSGYLPTFEITGGIEEVSESGNIFNNFAENSVKFTLSNIPSYIQYVILLFILFFILGFIRKFRRK